MRPRVVALAIGTAFGFVLSWAQVSDPEIIRRMLLLREVDVFLIMASAIAVAAIGLQILKRSQATAVVTREPVAWTVARPSWRHVAGSAIFGVGWALAGTCPGPMAAMIGEGHLGGLFVAAGVLAGIGVQNRAVRRAMGGSAVLGEPGATCV